MVVDTVVEAVDTIVESTNGQFITDIPNRASPLSRTNASDFPMQGFHGFVWFPI